MAATIAEGATDGSLLYTPAANFAGASDSFTYTLTDGNSVTNTGTVTINFLNRVWYVNGAAAVNGDGRSNSPFNNLNNAQAPSLAGDIIYVHTGGATTPGNLAMDASSTLQGAGGALSLNARRAGDSGRDAADAVGHRHTERQHGDQERQLLRRRRRRSTASGPWRRPRRSLIDGVSVTGGTSALQPDERHGDEHRRDREQLELHRIRVAPRCS